MATTTGTKVGPGSRKKVAVPKHEEVGLDNETLKEMYYYMEGFSPATAGL